MLFACARLPVISEFDHYAECARIRGLAGVDVLVPKNHLEVWALAMAMAMALALRSGQGSILWLFCPCIILIITTMVYYYDRCYLASHVC